MPSCLEDLFNPGQLLLAKLLIPDIDGGQQLSIAIHFSSNRHSLILDLQHFPILNVLQLFDVNSMAVQVSDPSFKTQDGLLQSDVKADLQVVSLTLEDRMCYLVEFQINVTWVKIEALLAFSLEEDDIAVLHAFFEIELQISWVDKDLVSSADWAFMTRSEAASSARLALHLDLLHLILHLHFPEHLPTPAAAGAGLLLPALVASSLAVLADLTPPEAVHLLASCVKFVQRDPHFGPEIAALPQWIFLEFFQARLAVQVIGDPLGNIDQDLVGPLDLHVLLPHLLVACIPIGMVLDGQPPERFLQLVTCGLFRDLEQIVEQRLSLRLDNDDEQQKGDEYWPGHNKI